MSLLSIVETIGKDILAGAKVGAEIVALVDPPLAPIMTELATIITSLEAKGIKITSAQLSQITQATSLLTTVKQTPPTNTITVTTSSSGGT